MKFIMVILFIKVVVNQEEVRRGVEFDYSYETWDNETTLDYYLMPPNKLSSTNEGVTTEAPFKPDSTDASPSADSSSNIMGNMRLESLRDLRKKEILEKRDSLQSGLFTASLAILFKVFSEIDPDHGSTLLGALQTEVTKHNHKKALERNVEFIDFATESVLEKLVNTDPYIVKAQAEQAVLLINERKTKIQPDLNAVLDIADQIFTEGDVDNVTKVLVNIQHYPNINNTYENITREAFEAFIVTPYNRVNGTEVRRKLMEMIALCMERRLATPGPDSLLPKLPRGEFKKSFRRDNFFNYNYENWENETTPDYFGVSAVASSVVTETTTAVLLPLDQTSPSTVVTSDTSFNITFIDVGVNISTTLSPVEEKLKEISDKRDSLQSGFYTASLFVLLTTFGDKELLHTIPLVAALHSEVLRLNRKIGFLMFGEAIPQIVEAETRSLALLDPFSLKAKAKLTAFAIDDRKKEVLADINTVLDVIDGIFSAEEVNNVAKVLADIKDYPNSNTSNINIARDALDAFIFIPQRRIEGTLEGKELLRVIEESVRFRYRPRRPGYRRLKRSLHNETTNSISARRLHIYISQDPTTTKFTYPDLYSVYLNDTRMRQLMKTRMEHYKIKWTKIRQDEYKASSKRGINTPPPTNATTTTIPPMHKSIFYIRKYVRKNLTKRTVTTKPTTTFRWRYYTNRRSNTEICNNRKQNSTEFSSFEYNDSDINNSKINIFSSEYCNSNNSDKLKNITQIKNKENIQTINSFQTLDRVNTKRKTYPLESKNTTTNIINRNDFKKLYNNVFTNRTILKIINSLRNIHVIKNRAEHKPSKEFNDEEILKVNLKYALIHPEPIHLRRILKHEKYLREVNFDTDNEVILKSNIYKALGYGNKFVK